ncbi:MAG TPA: hypothetical protein VFQ61_39620 [Polyangiaceae bacterium]|nr:hypothetical protein [Polyangiaceae bacterium]
MTTTHALAKRVCIGLLSSALLASLLERGSAADVPSVRDNLQRFKDRRDAAARRAAQGGAAATGGSTQGGSTQGGSGHGGSAHGGSSEKPPLPSPSTPKPAPTPTTSPKPPKPLPTPSPPPPAPPAPPLPTRPPPVPTGPPEPAPPPKPSPTGSARPINETSPAENGLDELRRSRSDRRRSEVDRLRSRWGSLLMDERARSELKLHAERMARLRRMRSIAEQERNLDLVRRIDELMTREERRSQSSLEALRQP